MKGVSGMCQPVISPSDVPEFSAGELSSGVGTGVVASVVSGVCGLSSAGAGVTVSGSPVGDGSGVTVGASSGTTFVTSGVGVGVSVGVGVGVVSFVSASSTTALTVTIRESGNIILSAESPAASSCRETLSSRVPKLTISYFVALLVPEECSSV